VRPVAAQGTQQRDGVDHRVPSHGTASDRYLYVHAVVAKAPAHFVAIPWIAFADHQRRADFRCGEDPRMAAIVQGFGSPLTVAQAQIHLQREKRRAGGHSLLGQRSRS